MITLNFSVDDQLLTRTDENTVAANSRLVHLCEFTFSSEWNNRGKVATFKKRNLRISVILDDDACTIPPEILQSENKIDIFELSVCGANGDSTITSTIVRVPILAGTWDPFTEEITPTLFEQIMDKIDEIEKGEISPELVLEAVTEYMEAHPLEPIIADDVAAYFAEHAEELKGDKGDTGATPNITATAEVNNAVGTPSVTVTKTGTAEAPNLNFAFQNLKGTKGDTGATPVISAAATVDNTTGTPAVNVSKTGTDAAPEFTFAFTGLKGAKGDPGPSYDDTEIKADIEKAVVKYTGNVTDANNVPVNTVYTVLASRNISNLPVNENGTLLTFNAYAVDTTLRAQFFLTDSNKLYHRHSFGGEGRFNAWVRCGEYVDEIDIDTPLYDDYLKDSYMLSSKTAVFFGDSITYGYAGTNQRLEHPYPEVFCANENMTGYNEGVSNSLFGVYGNNHRIIEQVTNSTHKDADIVFVAAGVNDWGYQTPIETFKTAVDEVIDYLLANYTATDIIFITPINANYTKGKGSILLSQYQSIITERVIIKDTSRRLSVVQGYKFDFPCTKNSADYRNIMFIDGLHPTQHGINTAYITGLTSALK